MTQKQIEEKLEYFDNEFAVLIASINSFTTAVKTIHMGIEQRDVVYSDNGKVMAERQRKQDDKIAHLIERIKLHERTLEVLTGLSK